MSEENKTEKESVRWDPNEEEHSTSMSATSTFDEEEFEDMVAAARASIEAEDDDMTPLPSSDEEHYAKETPAKFHDSSSSEGSLDLPTKKKPAERSDVGSPWTLASEQNSKRSHTSSEWEAVEAASPSAASRKKPLLPPSFGDKPVKNVTTTTTGDDDSASSSIGSGSMVDVKETMDIEKTDEKEIEKEDAVEKTDDDDVPAVQEPSEALQQDTKEAAGTADAMDLDRPDSPPVPVESKSIDLLMFGDPDTEIPAADTNKAPGAGTVDLLDDEELPPPKNEIEPEENPWLVSPEQSTISTGKSQDAGEPQSAPSLDDPPPDNPWLLSPEQSTISTGESQDGGEPQSTPSLDDPPPLQEEETVEHVQPYEENVAEPASPLPSMEEASMPSQEPQNKMAVEHQVSSPQALHAPSDEEAQQTSRAPEPDSPSAFQKPHHSSRAAEPASQFPLVGQPLQQGNDQKQVDSLTQEQPTTYLIPVDSAQDADAHHDSMAFMAAPAANVLGPSTSMSGSLTQEQPTTYLIPVESAQDADAHHDSMAVMAAPVLGPSTSTSGSLTQEQPTAYLIPVESAQDADAHHDSMAVMAAPAANVLGPSTSTMSGSFDPNPVNETEVGDTVVDVSESATTETASRPAEDTSTLSSDPRGNLRYDTMEDEESGAASGSMWRQDAPRARPQESLMAKTRSRAAVDMITLETTTTASALTAPQHVPLDEDDHAFIVNTALAKKRVRVVQLLLIGLVGVAVGFFGSFYVLSTCHFLTAESSVGNNQEAFDLHYGFWKYSPIDSAFDGYKYCTKYDEAYSGSAPYISRIGGVTASILGAVALLVLWYYLVTGRAKLAHWKWSVRFLVVAGCMQLLTFWFFADDVCRMHQCSMGPGSYVSIAVAIGWLVFAYEMHKNIPVSALVQELNPEGPGVNMVAGLEMSDFRNVAKSFVRRLTGKSDMPSLNQIQRMRGATPRAANLDVASSCRQSGTGAASYRPPVLV